MYDDITCTLLVMTIYGVPYSAADACLHERQSVYVVGVLVCKYGLQSCKVSKFHS